MFLAMNRFKVALGKEEVFENVWRERDSRLSDMKGFNGFKMLKGAPQEGFRTYCSHVFWDSEVDFKSWTNSDQFKAAHGKSNMPKGVILGPPNFEGYEVILER